MGQPLSVGLCLRVVVSVCLSQSLSLSVVSSVRRQHADITYGLHIVPVAAYCSLLHDGCDSWWSPRLTRLVSPSLVQCLVTAVTESF